MKKTLKIAILNQMIYKNFGSSHILVLACWFFSMDGSQRFGS